MKNLIITIIVGTLLLGSCTTSKNYYNYIVNGEKVETLEDANGQPIINVTQQHHIDVEVHEEGHGQGNGENPKDKDEFEIDDERSINELYAGAVERLEKTNTITPGQILISVEDYIGGVSGKAILKFIKNTSSENILDLTITNTNPSAVIVDFIPFAYHPALIYDDELMIAAGIISFRRLSDTNLTQQPSTQKYSIRIPAGSYAGNAMEVIVANSEKVQEHKHIGKKTYRGDTHRYGHKIGDPRKGN